MNRRLLALVALVVALPLFAFPVLSLPTDPGPQYVTWAHGVGDSVAEDGNFEIFEYEELTESERSFFDEAVETDSRFETPIETVPGRFEMLVSDDQASPLVHQDGYYYRVSGYVMDPGPPMMEILPRILSFVVSAALLSVAGFLYVDRERKRTNGDPGR